MLSKTMTIVRGDLYRLSFTQLTGKHKSSEILKFLERLTFPAGIKEMIALKGERMNSFSDQENCTLFTAWEKRYCGGKKTWRTCLLARFSAKLATAYLLNTLSIADFTFSPCFFNLIEVRRTSEGKPYLFFMPSLQADLTDWHWFVSLTHEKEAVGATVMIYAVKGDRSRPNFDNGL